MVDASVQSRATRTQRNLSLDALRGLIVVLMAVDHANYFVAQQHSTGEHWGGPFPAYDDALSFVTRLITHPVAPGFFFLMGVGMALFAASRRARGWSEAELIRHFVTRGLVLIALQFTVINLAWTTGVPPFPTFYQGVLSALGGCMILGSLVLRVRPALLAGLAGLLFVVIELSHPDPSLWGVVFDQPLGLVFGFSGGDATFWSNYPILAWLELVVLGLAFGTWMLSDPSKAFNTAMAVGAAFVVGFVLLRAADGFGNVRPRPTDDWVGFFNVVKYPPAMTFTLLTMGFNLIALGVFARIERGGVWVLERLAVLGSVPLFFYVAHLYVYSGLGNVLEPDGTSLPAMYLYWLAGLVLLYPACVWYGKLKRRHPDSLLRFL